MESQPKSHWMWRVNYSRFGRDYGLGVLLTLFSILWLLLMATTWAEAGDSVSADEEYSFNWLDPDKKIYVLQNRKYLKGGHALLTAMGGVGFSNPYRSTYNLDGRLAFYINETWGIEGFYTVINNSENNTVKALAVAAPTTLPAIREIRSQYGGMIHYVPWYAKINVFNNILYFDWYFGAGAGTLSTFVDTKTKVSDAPAYVQQDIFALFVATGHQYHLSQHFVFRVDVTGAFYQAPINGTTGESSWYSNYNVGLGLGWRL
jgi:outer membrane beta-barrel protein